MQEINLKKLAHQECCILNPLQQILPQISYLQQILEIALVNLII
jgi:hypothetical protein